MSKLDTVIETAYGLLNRGERWNSAQESYDTTALVRLVGELDRMLAEARDADGLRDMLLRLHGMAHTVREGRPVLHRFTAGMHCYLAVDPRRWRYKCRASLECSRTGRA
jgi:hypothetical protein